MKTLEQITNDAASKSATKLVGWTPESQIEKFVEGAEWERSRDKWIKCSDQQPALPEEYNIYGAGGVTTATWDGEKWFFEGMLLNNLLDQSKITHWQPMPQLPKE